MTDYLMKIFAAAGMLAATIASVHYFFFTEDDEMISMMEHEMMLGMENVLDFNDDEVRQLYNYQNNVMEKWDTLNFKIEENRTTGYEWIVDWRSCPDNVLQIETFIDYGPEGMDMMEEDQEPMMGGMGGMDDMVGVPGNRYFSLTAVTNST